MTADAVAVIVAAGASSRMGSDKIWADLGGQPVIAHSLATFAASSRVSGIVVVAPAERHEQVLAFPCAVPVACTEGGARRQDSVAAGLALAPDADWYLVHDGARPLVTRELVSRVLEAAEATGAAIPGVLVVDTIKRVANGRVRETVDRSALRAVQTPQAFAGPLLRRAHAEVTQDVTDDAAMVEHLGVEVAVAEGDSRNIKITTPDDLLVARALLAAQSQPGGL